MTSKLDRTITLSLSAVIVAALSSCTNVNDPAKAELSPKPGAKQQTASAGPQPLIGGGTQVATASASAPASQNTQQAADGQTPALATAPGQSAVTALANNTATNDAAKAITATAGHGPLPLARPQGGTLGPTVASVNAGAVMPAQVSETESVGLENEVLPADVTAMHSAVPMPRPASVAYAAQPGRPSVTSFAMLDARFDETPPGPPPSVAATPASVAAASPIRKPADSTSVAKGPTVINSLVAKYAGLYDMPANLIHRVINRESRYDSAAFNRGHYGLMQIKYNTAKSMGYSGPAEGLFDPETNLKYAIKYLRGAWMVADNNNDNAVRLYAKGYYNDAKRKGMLDDVQ
ncbi:transglycosylase SLT domain-containing protein [Allorhizobium undicola]|uniref:transglycosylase SLT domain-containing protein n=1 Tax=Allorhizobium undicola TaxID=78527 RepID=UPI003D33C503